MNAKGKEIAEAIEREVAEWTGLSVEISESKGHPKAKLKFGEMMLSIPFSGTPSSSQSIHHTLSDIRRTARKLGATRDKPEPSKDEDEAAYRKANPGREMRPDPVKAEPVEQKPGLAEQVAEVAKSGAIPEPKAAAAPRAKPQADPKPDYPAQVADGIYFGMPEDAYHRVERMSTTNLQRLMISEGDFWRDSWLNPNPPALTEEQLKKKNDARKVGDAYHKARLEPALFLAMYTRELSKADMPEGTIYSGAEMSDALGELGAKKSGSVAEQAERLVEYGYPGTVWHVELAKWREANMGLIPLAAETWDEIQADMKRLRANPGVVEHLEDGQAEVSVFWTDRHGIQHKCRFDYLKSRSWTDLKTFVNSQGKHVVQAINDAFRYNRYYVQAVEYRDGCEAIRVGGLQIVGEATDAQRKLIAEIQMAPGELQCWYVFIQKGGVPNIYAREFKFYSVPQNTKLGHAGATEEGVAAVEDGARTRTKIHRRGRVEIDWALERFHHYSQVYRPGEPWLPIEAVGTIDDMDFNDYWLSE